MGTRAGERAHGGGHGTPRGEGDTHTHEQGTHTHTHTGVGHTQSPLCTHTDTSTHTRTYSRGWHLLLAGDTGGTRSQSTESWEWGTARTQLNPDSPALLLSTPQTARTATKTAPKAPKCPKTGQWDQQPAGSQWCGLVLAQMVRPGHSGKPPAPFAPLCLSYWIFNALIHNNVFAAQFLPSLGNSLAVYPEFPVHTSG